MPSKNDSRMNYKDFTFEVKEVDEAKGEFTGIASMYGVEDLGGDVIEPGAFKKTISERPEVPILWQHNSGELMGKGRVSEEGNKIIVRGQLDMDDPEVKTRFGKLRKGLVSGLSIGFQAIKVTWEEQKEKVIRHINELKLWEVSIVTFPMLPEAQVTAVKQDPALSAEPEGTPTPEPPTPEPQAANQATEPEAVHSLLSFLREN